MKETAKIAAARVEVAERRAALIEAVRALQLRLQPAALVTEVWAKAKNKGADMAEEAVDAVRARPVAAGGIAAAVAMFLAREPIKDAAVKIYDAMTSRDDTKTRRPALIKKKPVKGTAKRPARRLSASMTKTEKTQ
ncbi:MAG: hypothetical protein H0W92_06395 [Sphingomonas sp.]|nr:hypothetical protein [Sphingomonas sp.]